MEYAQIVAHHHYTFHALGFDYRVEDWSWVGDSPVAQVNLWDLEELEKCRDSLSWQFEVLTVDRVRSRATIVRLDTAIPYYAYYRFERDIRAIANRLTWVGTRMFLLAQHLGKSRPPKRELTIDVNVSLPDFYAEAMQQLEERLAQVATTERTRAEELSELIRQSAIDTLRPMMQRMTEEAIERQTEQVEVRHFGGGGEVIISLPYFIRGGSGGGGGFVNQAQANNERLSDVLDQVGRRNFPTDTPIACNGCKNYHGAVYNGVPFVCAMHPYGVEDEVCADFESDSLKHCYFCDLLYEPSENSDRCDHCEFHEDQEE
jgi:hypothetical protein